MIEDINGTISGNIVTDLGEIVGSIILDEIVISGDITADTPIISGSVSSSTIPEVYEGEYTVTPKVNEQSLETKQRNMKYNVTVKAVPYHETSNKYGTTVSIVS